MAVLGKIIGGVLGFFLGGPLGAILGATAGHYVADDKKTRKKFFTNIGGNRSEVVFFSGLFSLIGKVASADGSISQQEVAVINQFIDRNFRLDPVRKNYAMAIVHQAARSHESAEDIAMQLRAELSSKPQVRELLIDILVAVAAADGSFLSTEERMIRNICAILGFADSFYFSVKERYVNADGSSRQQQYRQSHASSTSSLSEQQAYKILACEKGCSDEELKKAYRKLVKKYHPDALSSQGVSDDFREVAKRRYLEIQEAFDLLTARRKF
ncbi:MAG: co-chaperone DjlA [Spirochaetales bacterium]|nr:co-chaperone DjlA [Spirochaetales bacterium]